MRRLLALVLVGATAAGCASSAAIDDTERADLPSTTTSRIEASTTTTTTEPTTTTTLPVRPRPDWLGTRVLPLRPDGLGEIQPTPPELADRRFATVDVLPPPSGDEFDVTVTEPTDEVVARSTWTDVCPVERSDLRYVTLPFWGFDGLAHTGELLVHADAVDAVVAGFRLLHERGFPIEEMRIVESAELDLPPTGDGNNTSAFVCRPSVGSSAWSQHAYGRAVDVNPFHNPYVRGDVVIPELASSYVDRPALPGVLRADDVAAFEEAGWHWGGRWRSSKDWMHLSASGG